MIEWYKKVVLENYANFNGRARRSEYWYFTLANVIAAVVLAVVDSVIGIQILGSIYSLAVLVPGLAVAVRRLHDVNKSGWFYLLILLPVIGWIWLIVLFCTEGDKGTNEYGPDPKNQYDELDKMGTEY